MGLINIFNNIRNLSIFYFITEMKIQQSLIIVVLVVIINGSNGFKLMSPVEYPSNRQGNLYDTDVNELLYQKTLEALSQAAQESEEGYYNNNEDFNDDYLAIDPEEYDEIRTNHRDYETPSHSSLGEGFQYVQGGAGEGAQHLHPDGSALNTNEVKTDEELPAYCNPPNPCPIGYHGEECDSRPYKEFTAEYSKYHQEIQDCMCDDDHNDCSNHINKKSSDDYTKYIKDLQLNKKDERFSAVVAKKSPRMKRDLSRQQKFNPYLQGELLNHVAKKSVPV